MNNSIDKRRRLLTLGTLFLAACGGGGGGSNPTGTPPPTGGTSPTPSPGGNTPGIDWTTQRFNGSSGALAYGAGKMLSAGSETRSSTDLKNWASVTGNANDLAWDGKLFVAVGSAYSIYTSPDGIAWTGHNLPSGLGYMYAVVGSGSQWVVVGASGAILSSPDGITWTQRSLGTGSYGTLYDVIWTGAQFVATGESGLLATSPDGNTWTVRNSGTGDTFVGLGCSGTLIVASTFPYSGSSTAIYTSADGITWMQNGVGTSPILYDIVHVGGTWVGAGSYCMYHSSDGISWSAGTGPIRSIMSSVIHDGSKFVAGGSGTPGEVYSSVDGLTWLCETPGELAWEGITISPNGLMVAHAGDRSQASNDGVSWRYGRTVPNPGVNPIRNIVWYEPFGKFVALVQMAANQYLCESSDGLNWIDNNVYAFYNGSIAASPNLLVNISWGQSNQLYTSPDPRSGIASWTARTLPATVTLIKALWTGDRWLAMGYGGVLFASSDGVDWTQVAIGAALPDLYAAAVGNGLIVMVGSSGSILTSSDGGTTWTLRSSGTSNGLRDVVWTGAEFVAVGNSGTVVRSTNGIDWTVQNTPYTQTLYTNNQYALRGVVWTGSRIVMVGERGLVATSP